MDRQNSVTRPTVIFDGDCGFCRRWIALFQRRTGDRVAYLTRQSQESALGSKLYAQSATAVILLLPDSTVESGAAAIFHLLATEGTLSWPWRLYQRFPFLAFLSDAIYRHVATHRSFYSAAERLSGQCLGSDQEHRLTRWLLLRGVAVIYLVAFLSLASQVRGLIGSHGLLPAHLLLEAVGDQLGSTRYEVLPTLFWLDSSDTALSAACWAGAFFSVLLLIGILPVISTIMLWLLYFSLSIVGRDFLSFQWDALLLETGVLAVLIAPWRWVDWPAHAPIPSLTGLWLFRFLLFRFYLFCGLVKLMSGDPTWWTLRALDYHYFTQPLPNPLAWVAQQAPPSFQACSTLLMFGIELGLPFFIFGERSFRWIAFLGMAGLQILILLTGNHAFFNWLTLVLCLSLLDDSRLRSAFSWFRRFPEQATREPFAKVLLTSAAAIVLFGLGIFTSLLRLGNPPDLPSPVQSILKVNETLHLVNNYGVFAVMTTQRPEIIIEGSQDQLTWKEYTFRDKPGPLDRCPPFIAPFQPRLDWQMWFAALEAPDLPSWFKPLLVALFKNNPDILGLLADNPFPDQPPHWIRVRLYQYQLTTFAERRETGHWWKRTLDSELIAPVSLSP